ncbi:AfsR/SARP family transcriptional regulator [Promicromonospora sukumoe]|uniref:AfsR/SARP family transcriptional regulator n=1 Tax=Promicromonospora sukumoe TaxID=88382 RepID=UPI0037C7FC70
MQHVTSGTPTGARGEDLVVAVLGPVAVLSDAGPVAPRGARASALVAQLALAAPRAVTVSALVDALWGEGLPANPRAALQSLVSRLRALGPDVVRFTPAGYALGGLSDLDRARAAVAEARELLEQARDDDPAPDGGRAEAAAALLDDALALWRGEPGDGLADTTPGLAAELRDTAGRLRDELTTLRRRAAGATGDVATVTTLAGAAMAADPLDEDAARDLITALAGSGRPDEAVRVFGRLRHALVAELGADPAPDLVALHDRIAADAPVAPTAAASPSAPAPQADSAPPTPSGDPTQAVDATQGATPRPGAGRFVRGLRAPATPLIGRGDDVRAVVGELTAHRLVTVLGAGGLGKTRLAQEVARTVAADGDATASGPLEGLSIAIAELAGVRTDDDVALAIADGLGVSAVAGSARLADRLLAGDLRDRIVERARTARTLLVLDNCEHVPDGAARWADVLLSAAPGLRILTTSRAPLRLAAEQVYPLAPLASAAPAPGSTGTSGPTRGPAVELFRQRALAARPGARLPDDVVARLCDRLDGLPLAIELAAARVRTLSVEEIERHLGARFALLRGGDRTAPDRHRTLEAVIEWSWNLLEPSQRALWRRVSVLPDGLSAQAAAALGRLDGAGADDVGPARPGPEDPVPLDVLDDIDGLVTQSLLVVEEHSATSGTATSGTASPGTASPGTTTGTPAPVRYRMLETVREFGLLRFTEAGEDDAVRDALLTWGTGVARYCTSRLLGPEQVAAVDLLRREHENLLFTIRAAVRAGRPDVVVHGFVALGGAWTLRGAEERAADLAPAVLDAVTGWPVPAAEADVTALALAYAAATTAFSGTTANLRALARLRRVLRDHGDAVGPRTRAVASMLLAGEPGAVLALRDSDDPLIAFLAHLVASQEAENAGRLDEALAGAARAYDLAQGIGDVASRAGAAMFLATTAFGAGDARTAKRWSRVAREGLTVIGADGALRQLDWVDLGAAIADGDLAGAEAICARIEQDGTEADQSERGGDESRAVFRAGRAEIAWVRGDVDGTLDLYEQAVNVFADLPGVADGGASAGGSSGSASDGGSRVARPDAVGPPPAGRGDPSPAAPWAVIVGSAWIIRLVDAGQVARAAQIADVVRRRAVVLYREWMRHVADHPVLGTVCLAVGSVLTSSARPDPAVGLELLALAEALGSRQDFKALWRGPVLATAADQHGADAVASARAGVAAIPRENLAEHALTTLESLTTATPVNASR